MTRRHYVDNAPQVTLSAPVGTGDLDISVTSLVGFPTTFPYYVELDGGTSTAELILVTGVTGSIAHVTRSANGLGAFAHAATSGTFSHVAAANDFDEANAHVNANSDVHGVGPDSAVVGTNTTQTLANKTLLNPQVSGSVQGGLAVTGDQSVSGALAVAGATTLTGVATVGSLVTAGNIKFGSKSDAAGPFGKVKALRTTRYTLPTTTHTQVTVYDSVPIITSDLTFAAGVVTVTIPGTYKWAATITWDNATSANDGRRDLLLYVNGAALPYNDGRSVVTATAGSADWYQSAGGEVELVAGDQVQLYTWQGSGNSITANHIVFRLRRVDTD